MRLEKMKEMLMNTTKRRQIKSFVILINARIKSDILLQNPFFRWNEPNPINGYLQEKNERGLRI